MALLSLGAASLNKQSAAGGVPPLKSTKYHWYITPDPEAARQFLATKGYITKPFVRYKAKLNTPAKARPRLLPMGTYRLFAGVNNDNYLTDATATLSVTALVKACEQAAGVNKVTAPAMA